MSRPKILLITPWYPRPEGDQEGTFVREHAKAIQIHHDVTVLHCSLHVRDERFRRLWKFTKVEDSALTDGIPTYRLHYRGISSGGRGYSFILPWAMLHAFRSLLKLWGRPDLIHATIFTDALYAVIIGRLYGIPVVVTEHSTAFPSHSLAAANIRRAKFGFALADRVMPVSTALKEAIERYGIRANFQVVPNTVDTEVFTPELAVRPRGGILRLIFVAGLFPRKGLDILLNALARLPQRRDWILHIVGDGEQRGEYQQLAARLGQAEKVRFHGWITKLGVAELMRQMDLCIVPSLVETFSVVTIEAMACGIPVLATRCGRPEELINEETGILVQPGSVEILASALDTIIDRLDHYDRSAIARYAKGRFSRESVGEIFRELYVDVMQNGPAQKRP